MSRLAMRGSVPPTDRRTESEEDRQCYRRWARASYVVDFIVFAALLIGFSLYDRQTSRTERNDLTAGLDMRTMPVNSQNSSGVRK
ncbi:hypothetical protein ACVWYH_009417 [Bradyrhizobium sp. GM24.11]|jgi:hypothetical protein